MSFLVFFFEKKDRKKTFILEEVKKNRLPKVSIINNYQKYVTLHGELKE